MNNDDVYRPLILCTNPNTRPSRIGMATAAAPKFAPDVRPEMKRAPTKTAQIPTIAKVDIDWRKLNAICLRLNRRSCLR